VNGDGSVDVRQASKHSGQSIRARGKSSILRTPRKAGNFCLENPEGESDIRSAFAVMVGNEERFDPHTNSQRTFECSRESSLQLAREKIPG